MFSPKSSCRWAFQIIKTVQEGIDLPFFPSHYSPIWIRFPHWCTGKFSITSNPFMMNIITSKAQTRCLTCDHQGDLLSDNNCEFLMGTQFSSAIKPWFGLEAQQVKEGVHSSSLHCFPDLRGLREIVQWGRLRVLSSVPLFQFKVSPWSIWGLSYHKNSQLPSNCKSPWPSHLKCNI